MAEPNRPEEQPESSVAGPVLEGERTVSVDGDSAGAPLRPRVPPFYAQSEPTSGIGAAASPRADGRSLDLLIAMDEPLLLARELIEIANLGSQHPHTGSHWARIAGRMRDALRDIELMDAERKRNP